MPTHKDNAHLYAQDTVAKTVLAAAQAKRTAAQGRLTPVRVPRESRSSQWYSQVRHAWLHEPGIAVAPAPHHVVPDVSRTQCYGTLRHTAMPWPDGHPISPEKE